MYNINIFQSTAGWKLHKKEYYRKTEKEKLQTYELSSDIHL